MHLSIIGKPFLVGLAILTGATWAVSWLVLRRVASRVVARVVAVVLVVAFTGACVNAYYAYLPTVAALLGRRAADQISSAEFRALEEATAHAPGRALVGGRWRAARSVLTTGAGPSTGIVLSFVMPGTRSGFRPRTGQIYLPPAWFHYPRPLLPVIELLHGTPGSPADWTRAGYADLTADKWARSHGGVTPIIVMPDVNGSWSGDTECVNGKHGNAELYLTYDVRDAVVARFGASRRDWAVAGLSEGGTCALILALRHPTMFVAGADFSGDEYPSFTGADAYQYDPRWLIAQRRDFTKLPALWLSVGEFDGTRKHVLTFGEQARLDGFPTDVLILRGKHDFRVWRSSFSDALPWLVAHLDAESLPVRLARRP